jgi:hypothetical protein
MINLHNAILKLNPSVVTIRGDVAYDAEDNEVAYDKSTVEAYVKAHEYVEKRQTAYPSIVDQLDTLYHGGYDAWKAVIQTVKDKYPKEQA